ncbi:MAG TPA: L-idonate 5-dehydrogenase [Caulobacteraceae bacterium]|nr:L-idonate 5-dehydrogenase [Caulobacteraceae bacterium]
MLAAVLHGRSDLRVEPLADPPLGPDQVRVRVAFGGICGSDLHYYHRGAVGNFAVREPMVLGHEVSGVIAEVGSAVSGLALGAKAALDPSKPCRHCQFCIAGRSNLCENMRFLGSASLFPHIAGGFSQHLILRQDQVIPVPDETDLLKLSCAEPLSVALHAVRRAGPLMGKRVIVSGSGPIGLLTARAALQAGAIEVVATDIEDPPLAVARQQFGVSRTFNVGADPQALAPFESASGYFDVAFEASGSQAALNSLFAVAKRGGRIVQLGMLPPGLAGVPVNVLQSRELELVGAFRAHDEFRLAVDYIVGGILDVSPILSGVYALKDAQAAFERAGDRKQVIKLHLAL